MRSSYSPRLSNNPSFMITSSTFGATSSTMIKEDDQFLEEEYHDLEDVDD
jgi:hypothetical protein